MNSSPKYSPFIHRINLTPSVSMAQFRGARHFVVMGGTFDSREIEYAPTYHYFNLVLFQGYGGSPSSSIKPRHFEDWHTPPDPNIVPHLLVSYLCVVVGAALVLHLLSFLLMPDSVPTNSKIISPGPSVSLPPLPVIYGRDEFLGDVINKILQNSGVRRHICIRGGPGMGKTASAIGIMYNDRIVQHFGDRRHWVKCQEASAVEDNEKAATLLEYISNSFGLDLTASSDLRKNIKYFLDNDDVPRIIVLDNFETMWEPPDAQEATESVLEFLAQFPQLTIIVTTRNAHNPATQRGVLWHTLDSIQPLSPNASAALFTSLSLPTSIDTCLKDLLDAVGYVPLAIVLMASFGQENYTTAEILEIWHSRGWLFQRTPGTRYNDSDPINKLDNSIAMSLEGPLIQSNADSPTLLRIIAGLPAGIKRENLQKTVPSIPNANQCAASLVRSSLLMNSRNTLQMHSTIRSFMLRNYIIDPIHEANVHDFYFHLIRDAGGYPGSPHFLERSRKLQSEETNAEAILLDALHHNFSSWISIALDYSHYQIWNTPSVNMTRLIVDLMRQSSLDVMQSMVTRRTESMAEWWRYLIVPGSEKKGVNHANLTTDTTTHSLLPLPLLRLGMIYFRMDMYLEATEVVQEAIDRFGEIGELSGVAEARSVLAEISRLRGENTRALQLYSQAYMKFNAAGNTRGMSSSLRATGVIYFSDDRLSDAVRTIDMALKTCSPVDHICIADCERVLGRVYRLHNQTESIRWSSRAREYYLAHGPRGYAAMALYQMSIALYLKGEYDEAERGFNQALDEFRFVRNDAQVGYCVFHIGEMNFLRGTLQEALDNFHRATTMFKHIENRFMVGLSLRRQAESYARQCRVTEARQAYESATVFLKDADTKEAAIPDIQSIDSMCEFSIGFRYTVLRYRLLFVCVILCFLVVIYKGITSIFHTDSN